MVGMRGVGVLEEVFQEKFVAWNALNGHDEVELEVGLRVRGVRLCGLIMGGG